MIKHLFNMSGKYQLNHVTDLKIVSSYNVHMYTDGYFMLQCDIFSILLCL